MLSRHNDVLGAWALTVVLFGGLTAVFGVKVLPFLVIQAVFGFLLLMASRAACCSDSLYFTS